jgi:phosphatidylserine decarboxylase precursor
LLTGIASVGKREATPASRNRIQQFVDTFNINMDDFEPSDINAYPTFEDFFIRRHKPGSRPIYEPDNNSSAVVVADSRVVVYEAVAESKKIWIKGEDFSITNLVMDKKIGPQFHDGPIASFRLSPQDYHRYHSPVSGRVKVYRSMPGDYYDVDPLAIQSGVDILTRNARDYVVIETEEFGEVLFVAIGASQVGTVECVFTYCYFYWFSFMLPLSVSTNAVPTGSTKSGKRPARRSKRATRWDSSSLGDQVSLLRFRGEGFNLMRI